MNSVINGIKRLNHLLRYNKVTFGGWQALSHTSITEIMATAGFSWLVIDMEHSVIELSSLQPLLQVAQASGCPAFVRVPVNDATIIKRVMDAGSSGLMVPQVNSSQDVERAVSALRYHPIGERGVGLARAHSYGRDFKRYINCNNESAVLIVQIEHIQAIENIDSILSHKQVRGFLIGPYDLSASLGIPGKLNHPLVKEAERKVMEAAKRYKKVAGIHIVHPTRQIIKEKLKMGFKMVALSTDFLFLENSCRVLLTSLKSGV